MNNLQEGKVKMTNYRWVITAMLFCYYDQLSRSSGTFANMERFFCA